jgi:hypothetical protein
MTAPSVLEITKNALAPFANQQNTGNVYEIRVILEFARRMGLSNDDLDSMSSLFEIIESRGKGNEGTIEIAPKIREIAVGNGLRFGGKTIVNMRNLTQSDGDGGTGDLMLIADDGKEISISVTGSDRMSEGKLEKCLSNPSYKRYGCEEDKAELERINDASPLQKENELVAKFGEDRSTWPKVKRIKTDTAVNACNAVVKLAIQRFNTFTDEKKRELMNDIHLLHKSPADYLAIVTRNGVHYYKFGPNRMDKNTWTPRLVERSVYIDVYNGETLVSSTQVKFNNGVGSGLKKWNLYAKLNSLYIMMKMKNPFV